MMTGVEDIGGGKDMRGAKTMTEMGATEGGIRNEECNGALGFSHCSVREDGQRR
jgi:hypothetical protein